MQQTIANLTHATILAYLEDLFMRSATHSYLGESVSMAEHMLQTAARAEDYGADNPLVLACLLHDVGHYAGEFGEDHLESGIDNAHESVGAKFLARFFPASVWQPIGLHVAAKRYLCATDEHYFDTLSPASVATLKLQGGVMGPPEIQWFTEQAYFHQAVILRRCDDAGKVIGAPTREFAAYRPLLDSLLTER